MGLHVGVAGAATQEYVAGFAEVGLGDVARVGGKGARLGELSRIDGVRVPAGFCVTTEAFRAARAADGMPAQVAAAIAAVLAPFGDGTAFAVRSSGTVEDSAAASFAGQHDSYLGVVGVEAVLARVERVWASLLTERAVAYRARHGVDAADAEMAVVVQRMVVARASGVLFTADPISGNRRISSIDATPGLGDALVSGLVTPDTYKVRDESVSVIERRLASEQLSGSETSNDGGAQVPSSEPRLGERDRQPVLTDAEIVELTQIGRTIEARFGAPQDIEWCLDASGEFAIVQARPITNLYPVPAQASDGEPHVYVSVGHQQMMTDAMKPLGLSMWQMVALPPMHEAGGRLFVDIAPRLVSAASRDATIAALGQHDPLLDTALRELVARDDGFIELDAAAPPQPPARGIGNAAPVGAGPDPAIVGELIAASEANRAEFARAISAAAGPVVFDLIRTDIVARKQDRVDPVGNQAVMAGMEAAWWLSEHLDEWLGDRSLSDAITQSAPGNITSEMGLALLDVADVIRPHAEVVAFLERIADDARDQHVAVAPVPDQDGDTPTDRPHADSLLADLAALSPAGAEAGAAIARFLERYGIRCVGEIDITRPRWTEAPQTLLPQLLSNVRHFEHGAGQARFAAGHAEADAKTEEVLTRLRALPDGDAKAAETAAMIDRLRAFIGYREYPKYDIISRHFAYKQALMAEIAQLVAAGTLATTEDAFFLTFDELERLALTGGTDDGGDPSDPTNPSTPGNPADPALVAARRAAFAASERLAPPRLLTSDGEVLTGSYARDDAPAGALIGLGVSRGTIEGRARVIRDPADADLAPGEILVTRFTDPSWTPVFVTAAALVTEVGGLMTHGAVIAREYGLPAVVGVVDATRLITDGQHVRVHGADGYVELLDRP